MDNNIDSTIDSTNDLMNCSVTYSGGMFTTGVTNCYDWYRNYYLPQYPYGYFYPAPCTKDKGEQALGIVKALMDKDLIKKIDKVRDFVDLMDAIIKIL